VSARLLPWTGEDGKACLLGEGDGTPTFLSRLADLAEEVQLGMAEDLLGHIREVLAEGKVSEGEWRHLVMCLNWSLRDVLRVAESRGDRLPVPDEDEKHRESTRRAQAVLDRAFTWSGGSASAAPPVGGEP
jgi:hypothetical protein